MMRLLQTCNCLFLALCTLLAAPLLAWSQDAPPAETPAAAETSAPPSATAVDADAWGREMAAFFAGAEVRTLGSPGNAAMEARLAALFAASGYSHGEIRFDAPAFRPGATHITHPELGELALLPMHAGIFRPGNFLETDFSAPLVYAGRAGVDDLAALNGQDLRGSIAVVEFDSADQWLNLMRFGVKGFIFLAADSYQQSQAEQKVTNTEVSVPRFFLQSPAADRLRQALQAAAAPVTVAVHAEPSTWVNTTVRDLWVFIPGTDTQTLGRQVVPIIAAMDSNGVVPDLAASANTGANLFLLTKLLADLQARPPQASVMLIAVNARTQGMVGDRALAFNLLNGADEPLKLRAQLTSFIRRNRLILDYYGALNLDRLAPTVDQRLAELREIVVSRFGRSASIEGDVLVVGEPLPDAEASGSIAESQGILQVLTGSVLDFTAYPRIRLVEAKTVEQQLIEMRHTIDDSLGLKIKVKQPLMDRARREVNQLKSARVEITKSAMSEAQKAVALEALEMDFQDRVTILTMFNKVGQKAKLSELSETQLAIFRGYLEDEIEAHATWLALDEAERNLLTQNRAIYDALEGRSIPLVLHLGLDWNSSQIGFNSLRDRGNPYAPVELGKLLAQIGGDVDALRGETQYCDAMTNLGGLIQEHFFRDDSRPMSFYQATGRTPTLTLRNPFSSRPLVFTPHDDIAHLNMAQVASQSAYVLDYLQALLRHPKLPATARLKPPIQNRDANAVIVVADEADEFSAENVLRRPEAAIMLYRQLVGDETKKLYPAIIDDEIVPAYIQITDARAQRIFYQINDRQWVNAFNFDPEFRHITYMVDAGEMAMKKPPVVDLGQQRRPVILFPVAEEFVIDSRIDPTLLSSAEIRLDQVQVLDGIMNSAPRSFGLLGMNSVSAKKQVPVGIGPVAVTLKEDIRLKLLAQGQRLAINPTEEEPEGIGYADDAEMGDDLYAAAVSDMEALNAFRLGRMVGVTNQLATDLYARGSTASSQVSEAAKAHDHLGFLRSLYESLGAHTKAYSQVNGMTEDMLKAIIFYMLLMLPFCFFVQKLLFKFVRIEAQMGAFAVIFVTIFAVFRFIHPAFRIARAPEAILIAFVMFSLGAFVIIILHSRFEGEMKLLFQTFTGVNADEVGHGAVLQKALLIGVNNMKRRRVRTALTTGTVVLVTFAMLSFSSVSKKMSPTFVPITGSAPYTGVYFHLPGSGMLNTDVTRAFSEIFSASAEQIVVRAWDRPPVDEKGSSYPFSVQRQGGPAAPIVATLGLGTNEPGLLSPAGLPIKDGGHYFSSDRAREALLPVSLATALGVSETDVGTATLIYRGLELTVVGLLDDSRLAGLEELDGRSVLPLEARQPAGALSAEPGDGGGEEAVAVHYVDTAQLLVLPYETALALGASPYSVSVLLKDGVSPWTAIDQLLTVTNIKFWVSSRSGFLAGPEQKSSMEAGIYYVGSNYKTSIGGLTRLIIPVLIAGTIILNTMLGSVYERKYEIAVYNAIGLNPTHIFMFFLAEAAVYAVLGSVGGYLVGQVLALLITSFNLIQGLNLNFSSMMVVYVIAFTVLIVVLSTLYPAYVATRAAVPSGKRKWSLPDHDGDTMSLLLPFIYQPRLAPGIVAYLDDYFQRFSEASTGEMISTLVRKERVEAAAADGQPDYHLTYDLALAPYDLGVTQQINFHTHFNTNIQSFQIEMGIQRLSGQDSNWVTTNKPFLERLRKHMMHWRNMSADNQDIYVARARADFDGETYVPGAPGPEPFQENSVPVSEAQTGAAPERDQAVHDGELALFDEGGGPESRDEFERLHPKPEPKAGESDDPAAPKQP